MNYAREAFQERSYRNNILKNNLKKFNVTFRESDIFISADFFFRNEALFSIYKYRSYLESYISAHQEFLTSLVPVQHDHFAPAIIRDMMIAARKADVGPMAAVAGAIAEYVGMDLLQYSRNVIVENGGDVFIESQNDIHVGISAGDSPLSDKISLIVRKNEMPIGICTSSGTVGHSLSFGKADAVCVKAKSVPLADAAATAIGNIVKSRKDIYQALHAGIKIEDVLGIVIIVDDQFGAIGNVELANYKGM
jgi:ApbE superfamily uncharacterized protein (UPF0280 family)